MVKPICAYGQPIFHMEVRQGDYRRTVRLGLGMTEFEAVDYFCGQAERFASIHTQLRLFTETGRRLPNGNWTIFETTLAVTDPLVRMDA